MTDEARLQRWLNDQRRVRPRTFQSREIVWSTFESMARELEAPIDQLIGEAMTSYATDRGYVVPEDPPETPSPGRWASPVMHEQHDAYDALEETHDAPSVSELDRSYSPPGRRLPAPRAADSAWSEEDLARTQTRGAFDRPPAAGRPPPDALRGRDLAEESRTTPRRGRPPPSHSREPGAYMHPRTPSAGVPTARAAPADRESRPVPRAAPPPRMHEPPRESSSPGAKQLVLHYEGERHVVDKDRYLLGRSKTQADLKLDDPNVSRQHAVIERVGSAWYIVDLGSTNGILVAGERVARRALADGDLIVITSHEIRCSLR